jgi:hypothetical protein
MRLTGVTGKLIVFTFLSAAIAISASCAPVTYNRYQTAQTIGQGNVKAIAAIDKSHELMMLKNMDIYAKVDEKLVDWSFEHPGNEEEVAEIVGLDVLDSFTTATVGATTFDVEAALAVGVTDWVDLEARATATGYFRGNAKFLVHKFGKRGAVAISPGAGYRGVDSGKVDIGSGAEDHYKGTVWTGELPIIIGWQWDHFSPYIAPMYAYHRLNVAYTRKVKDLSPSFEATINDSFDYHSVGLAAGVQMKIGGFICTPEIIGLYTMLDDLDYTMIYPGIAIGGLFE